MATATSTKKTTSRARSNGGGNVAAADVQAGLEQVQRDIDNLTRTLARFGKERAGDLKSKTAAKADELSQVSAKALEDLKASAGDLNKQIEARVHEKPMQSLAIAAGVGALIAMLLRR